MAPKRSSALDEPPPEASSAEEEDTTSGEDSGSSSSEEDAAEATQSLNPKKPAALPSTPAIEKKPASKKPELAVVSPAHQSSSSETGSGSDSDAEVGSGRNVKPMDETLQVKKPRSKPSASVSVAPARSGLKRPSETAKHPKRAKKGSDGHVVVEKSFDESKKLFQRLWSEDDEIAILNGIIDYTATKGSDPGLDMNAFHDSIKKALHVDVTKAQLVDKIRRLKKKYRNNAERGKKGADPMFSKHHEQKGFELSKKIWGDEGVARTPGVEQLKANAEKIQRGSSSCMGGFRAFERSLGAVGLPESFLKPGLELTEQSKRTELEEEWKKLHIAELELFLKRTELISGQAKLILEAYKSSDKEKKIKLKLKP